MGRSSRVRRGKWRQQKLAVGTVQQIAKEVTRLEMQKGIEPKWTINKLGVPERNITQNPFRCIILKTGLWLLGQTTGANPTLTSTQQLALQHHPQTTPSYQIGTGAAGQPIESGPRTRTGDTIAMTGLDVSGYIELGKDLSNAAVHIGLYKADQELDAVVLLPDLNEFKIRRQIDNSERPNKISSRTMVLNHRSADHGTRRKFQLYHRFKKPRRVKYNDGQTSDQTINQARYQDDRYYLVAYSDVPDEVTSGGIAAGQPASDYQSVLDKNVSFWGRFTAYYRDA